MTSSPGNPVLLAVVVAIGVISASYIVAPPVRLPPPVVRFTSDELTRHDGSDPSVPIFAVLDRKVYDVSSAADLYGPGRSLHALTGADHSRYAVGHAGPHLDDTSKLTADERARLDRFIAAVAARHRMVGELVGPACLREDGCPVE
eukprot:TRINITY_DN34200_c0_g1_i1.p1 TRINITY_DN34200_c0_g1~~TRINITY_DN34200_c0_g1_i1.p1  ORF type:complete len:146 (-),score=10.91 TRINITY_DN34200_c0_g1_i1:112-549(-)